MQDEIDEVLRLIALPIKCRNKLISGECKFVLNSGLLHKLNRVLDIVHNDSVDIILSEGQRKALELFIKIIGIIPKLVVSQRTAESFDNVIDLRKFKQLRYLELIRVCLDNTVGIDKLKTQLVTFICNRSSKCEEFLFHQKKLQWAELKCLDLRYSLLTQVDDEFFKHMPWIQTLDLSFNKLQTIDGLQCLDNLRCLNLSFNHIKNYPSFSKSAQTNLEVLILSNNHISTMSGLQVFVNLKTLDLSSNWISQKSELLFLNPLKALCYLNLMENPVSFFKYYRIYVSSSLSENIPSQKFVLDNLPLNSKELEFIGSKFLSMINSSNPECERSSSTMNTLVQDETPPEIKVRKKVKPPKKSRKPREVIIHDSSTEEIFRVPKVNSSKDNKFQTPQNIIPEVTNESSEEKEKALMKQLVDIEIKVDPQPETDLLKNEEAESSEANDVESTIILVSATVHAPEKNEDLISQSETTELGEKDSNVSEISRENSVISIEKPIDSEIIEQVYEKDFDDKRLVSNEESEILNETSSDLNESLMNNGNMNNRINQSSDSLSEDSDVEDEVLWHVQRKDNVTGIFQNIILVLLDDELKERSTINNQAIARWPLSSVQSCTKTKTDPLTVELEFDTLKKDKRSRTYIMEFADAQVLLKKMYSILEARPLSDMNQRTYKCIKCAAMFVHDTPSAFKTRGSLISCSICSSTLVVEVEEPRLPQQKDISFPPVSHSSSQSSIGKGNLKSGETASKDWKTQWSATSLEPGRPKRKYSSQKYESDIEVISNPSQSSIEVIDEHSRSGTPRRKISSEEKQPINIGIPPQLSTVVEATSPFNNLTESSSSGSLTESVITAYEALNINKKKFSDEEVLTEEESSPSSEPHPPETIEEIIPTTIWKNEGDIYSYTDFIDVDARVKLFLYQMLFEDDNEGLLMIAKCHLWKTGGSDYDGCIVISNLKMYFLSHSRTNFKEDTCDWLSKCDSYSLKDVKEVAPLLWQQGVRIQIKRFFYLVLLMDQERNSNFLKFFKGLSLEGIKILNNPTNTSELSLQQAVLSACSISQSFDPTVNFFTICLSFTILKDDVEDETLRLGGLVLTTREFHLIPGELSWLSTTSVPSVVASQEMSRLIEVEKGKQLVNLHFLDEKEALEEVWCLKCTSDYQVSSIVDAIRIPWEQLFSVSLEVRTLP